MPSSRYQFAFSSFLSILILIPTLSGYATSNNSTKTDKHPLLIKAKSFFKVRDFDNTILYCQKILEKLNAKNDLEDVIEVHNLLGAAYIKKRSYENAFAIINKGLEFGLDHFPPEHPLVSESYYYMGVFYDLTSKAEQSIANHQKALNIRLKHFGNNHLKVAESFNGLGEVYMFTIFDFKKARNFFQKSVHILELQLKSDEYELYVGYFNLARANRQLGDLDKALTFAFKAFSVINSKKEYYIYLERCYTLLGDIYYSKTDYLKAVEYIQKGIAQSILTDGQNNYELILKYTNLGVAYSQIMKQQLAIQSFKKSLQIYNLHDHRNSALQGDNFMNLGKSFQKAGEFDSAKFYLKKAFTVQLKNNGLKHFRTRDALQHLAKLFQDFKYHDSAAFYIQKSIVAAIEKFTPGDFFVNPDIKSIENHDDMFSTFAEKGSMLLDLYLANPSNLKNLETSLSCYKISDQLMELNRNSYQGEESKLFFADHYHNIYEKALEVSFLLFEKTKNQSYFEDALMFMEKNKAFILAESLQKAEMFSQAGLPDSIRDMERNLNSELAHNKSLLEDNKAKNDSKEEQRIQAEVFQLSQKQEKLHSEIARQYPNYFLVKYQTLSGLSHIREYARRTNSTVIEYFWGDKKVYLIAVTGDNIIFKEIAHADSLKNVIVKYFNEIQRGPGQDNEKEKFESFFSSGQTIYDQLVAPALQQNNIPEKLIIIRDGPLLLIPFESLPVSKINSNQKDYQILDYLLQHYTISYAHSANLLVKGSSRPQRSDENKVLAFSYSMLNEFQKAEAVRNQPSGELPGTARELQAIAQLLPGLFFQGEEATEQKFKVHASEFDILHLAVHGRADPEKQFSGSLFFKPLQDTVDDGELHIYELYDLNLKAKLTVLSACESGVGKLYKGEGVFSIARGFDYAGCPSTVMTLWAVSDMTSAQIMTSFYQELNEGREIDVALRSAKLAYLKTAHSKLTHPAYWAAFIPTGNMEAIIDKSNKALIILIAIIGVIGISAFLLFRKMRRRAMEPSFR